MGLGGTVTVAVLVASAAPASAVTLPAGFADELVTTSPSPTALAFTPDGRMLIAHQPGQLRVARRRNACCRRPALDLSPLVCTNSERGLLGVAVDPAFATNRFIYLYYTFNASSPAARRRRRRPSGQPRLALHAARQQRRRPGQRDGADRQHPVARTATTTAATCSSARTATCTSASATAAATTPAAAAPAPTTPRATSTCCSARSCASRPSGGDPRRQPVPGPRQRALQHDRPHDRRQQLPARRSPGACATRSGSRSIPTPPARASSSTTSARTRGRRSTTAGAGADYGWNVREGHCANGSTTNCGAPPAGMTNPIFDYGRGDGCASITGGAFVPNGVWPARVRRRATCSATTSAAGSSRSPNGAGGCARSFADRPGRAAAPCTSLFGPYGAAQALYYTTYAGGGAGAPDRLRVHRQPGADRAADRLAVGRPARWRSRSTAPPAATPMPATR